MPVFMEFPLALPFEIAVNLACEYGLLLKEARQSQLSCALSKLFDILQPNAASFCSDPFDVAINQ